MAYLASIGIQPCNRTAMWWQNHLSEFVTFLLVINPLAALPTFMALTAPFERGQQRKIALTAVLAALALLVFFVVGGGFLLRRIGIAIRAFQIAGGIVVFLVALDMVHGRIQAGPDESLASNRALAIYPLAFPIIAGPGSLITAVLLTDDDRFNFPGQLATIGVIVVVLAIQFAALLAARPISRAIGDAGVSVIGRIMGMLLAALAVSMILTAVGEWLNLPTL
jgi:multiple antibiotic resistance protein